MKTFLVPDMHGRSDLLLDLLRKAGIVDENGEKTELGRSIRLVSIGDLFDGSTRYLALDEQMLKYVDLFDLLLVGNHEAAFLGLKEFGGYHRYSDIPIAYKRLEREGKIAPALLVGETLVVHAGVHESFSFKSAAEAYDAISDAWLNDRNGTLIDGIGPRRGGSQVNGGILWSDWNEPKNTNFNQVVGHTPHENGPVMNDWTDDFGYVYHLNIDCGAKQGNNPVGVWLDEEGNVDGFVPAFSEPEPAGDFFSGATEVEIMPAVKP